MNDHDDRTSGSLLAGLPRQLTPPPGMEERVVEALATRQLLRRGRRGRLWLPLAASLVGLLAGWMLRGLPRSAASAPQASGLYLLLLSNDPEVGPSIDERVRLYASWARQLAADGQLEIAKKLEDGGVVVDTDAGGAGGDLRPLTRDTSTPSGFYLVRAESLDEAVELARESPHVGLGGRITVRPIDPV